MGDQCLRDGGAAVAATMVVSVGALTVFSGFSSSQATRSCRKKKKEMWVVSSRALCWGHCFFLGAPPAFLDLLCSSQSPEAVAPQPGAPPARVDHRSLTVSLPVWSGSS